MAPISVRNNVGGAMIPSHINTFNRCHILKINERHSEIPRYGIMPHFPLPVVRKCSMTFLSHPSCFSGFIQDFLDHYTLEWQKEVSAYL